MDSSRLRGEACTLVALWRAPERMMAAKPYKNVPTVIDVSSFGETGIVAARRNANGLPLPIPHGVISVPRGAIGAMTVIETARSGTGTLLLRGPMVPAAAFPPGADALHLSPDLAGYFDMPARCIEPDDRDYRAASQRCPHRSATACGKTTSTLALKRQHPTQPSSRFPIARSDTGSPAPLRTKKRSPRKAPMR